MSRMKYRDDMSSEDLASLLAEIAALESAYADAGAIEAPPEDSLEYFNHHIAGDRPVTQGDHLAVSDWRMP